MARGAGPSLGRARRAGVIAAVTCCAFACGPGDGSTLDEHGRAFAHPYAAGIGSKLGEADFPPTYTGVAEGFFARFCTECHAGAEARKGLDLTLEAAYDGLVNVPAVERAEYNRVEPGDAGASYLIVKLEGGPAMAGRLMPRGRPARPQSEIDAVRAWIDDGAPYN